MASLIVCSLIALAEPISTALNGVMKNGDYQQVLNRWGEGVERIDRCRVNFGTIDPLHPFAPAVQHLLVVAVFHYAVQREAIFREVSPEAAELQPILTGLFGEYAARYGDYFSVPPSAGHKAYRHPSR
jgi:hypothetical protein